MEEEKPQGDGRSLLSVSMLPICFHARKLLTKLLFLNIPLDIWVVLAEPPITAYSVPK